MRTREQDKNLFFKNFDERSHSENHRLKSRIFSKRKWGDIIKYTIFKGRRLDQGDSTLYFLGAYVVIVNENPTCFTYTSKKFKVLKRESRNC